MKTFVFVPHQDDEVNLIGNCVDSFLKISDVYIVYSSIDRDAKKANIRKDEAQRACKILGIKASNVIFLDFPDTPNREGHHFFADKREQVVEKLINVLLKYKPDIIIGTDFDFHSDHRMLSLALDSAVCEFIKKHGHRPLYLKGFCYETAFYSTPDYFSSKNGEVVPLEETLSNPSFEWKGRLSIKSTEQCKFIFERKAFRALQQHKSQYAVLKAESILNSNNVFWQKRTDNILLDDEIKIEVSSGDKTKLNDMLILDTDDIVTEEPRLIDYGRANWVPVQDDFSPFISFTFPNETVVKKIVFHGDISIEEMNRIEGNIETDNDKIPFSLLSSYGRGTAVNLKGKATNHMTISFNEPVAISEIELFSDDVNKDFESLIERLFNETEEYDKENFAVGKLIYLIYCILLRIKRKTIKTIFRE